MSDYEKGHFVKASRRKIGEALPEWLADYRAFAQAVDGAELAKLRCVLRHPYIGKRAIQDIDGAVCDALYAKLLTEGRVKARPASGKPARVPVHTRRVAPDGRVLECRPYRYDKLRCYRRHESDYPALGQPIEAKKRQQKATRADRAEQVRPGLDPKTVVNTHRMLHRAWEDFVAWGWAKRDVVNDAHPPRVVRKGRKVWTVAQLRPFCDAPGWTGSSPCGCCEATSGMRRCELAGARRDLLDLDAGTLTTEVTRVVVDGKVIESDGKTANAQHVIALDPFTLAALKVHTELLDAERAEFGPDYLRPRAAVLLGERHTAAPRHDHPPVPQLARRPDCQDQPHDVRHSYATAGRDAKIDWKALSQRIGHADVAFTMKQYVQADLEADRQVANTLAELIIGGSLVSVDLMMARAATTPARPRETRSR